jgi:hypothetical protein
MKPILSLFLVLFGASSLLAQGTPPPPVDEPPAELLEEPPLEDEVPPMDGEDADDLPSTKREKAAPKAPAVLKARVRAKPGKPGKPGKVRLNVDVEDQHIADVMEAIGRQAGVSVLVAPGVEEEITVSLREIPWREAVEVIAKICRCEIREPWPGVLLVEQPAKVTTVLDEVPLHVACEQISETASLDLVIGPKASGKVSLDLKEVDGLEALRLAARSAGVSVLVEEGVALVTKAPLRARPKPKTRAPKDAAPYVDLEIVDGHLDDATVKLAKEAGLKLIVDPGLSRPLTLSLTGVSWRVAVEALAFSAGAKVEELRGGIVRLAREPEASRPLRLVEVDLREALTELAAAAELSVVVDPALSARVTVSLARSPRATFFGLIRAARLEASKDSAGVIWVGAQSAAGASVAAATSQTKPTGQLVDLSFKRVELADAMEQVGLEVQRNILVDPSIVAHVTCHLHQVDWRLALDAIATSQGCVVEDRGHGVLLFTQPPRNRVVAKAAPVGPMLRALAAAAGVNLVLTPEVKGSVSFDLRNVYPMGALRVAAEVSGCKLVAGKNEAVIVVRDHDAATWVAVPDRTYQKEVARLVERVEAAALGGDLRALARASQALREAVERVQPKPRIPAPVPELEITPQRREAMERLRSKIERGLRARDAEGLVGLLQDLRGELRDALGLAVAKKVFSKPFAGGSSEITLSIRLQIQIAEGNLLLEAMARAISQEHYDEALLQFEGIKELKERMFQEERSVFQRNAAALYVRGRSLAKRAERLRRIEELFGGLRVQATFTQPDEDRFTPLAIVNGRVVYQGDRKAGLPSLVEVAPGRVRFEHEGVEFIRAVE